MKTYDWAEGHIARLEEDLKDFKAKSKEAQEQFFEDVPKSWAYIKIDGRPVFQRESKPGQKRVSVEYLREHHPKIAEEAEQQKPTYSVKRIR